MKKVTILALHLGYGGIENVISTLANTLSSKYDVEIISTYKLYNEPAYKLDEKVKVTYLKEDLKPNKKEIEHYFKNKNYSLLIKELLKAVKIYFLRRHLMVKAIKNVDTDVLISTRTLHNNWVSKYGKGSYRKIAWEHNHHNNDKKYIKKLVKSCKNIDNLVLVSKELAAFYKTYLGNKVVYIPNSLDKIPNKYSKLEEKNIISVGRLSKEKGFDDLLKVFKKISLKHSDWKLNIIGDGLEKNELLNLAKELKLGDKVVFHGFQNKEYINECLLKSSIYVMTSHTESFGLVLVEAMSFGIPCVSYTSAQGANEIIKNEETGFLIENRDSEEMISKIDLLIEDDKLRKKMGQNAKNESKSYAPEFILDKWSKLINKRK